MSIEIWADGASIVLGCVGAFFILAGTVGLLRFPDTLSRLHALTKADNLGLGFIALALMLQSDSLSVVLKLALIWGLALLAGSTSCYLIGRHVLGPAEPYSPKEERND